MQKIFEFLKDKKVGVFCDDSNLYHSYQKYGWRINFRKLKEFLETICDLKFINYHLAIPDRRDPAFKGTEKFLSRVKQCVVLKTKPLKYLTSDEKNFKKADVDVEIVLDVVRNVDNLDVVMIVSGDSDFLELKNYVVNDKKKMILFVGYEENMAWELRQCWHLYLNRIKDNVILR